MISYPILNFDFIIIVQICDVSVAYILGTREGLHHSVLCAVQHPAGNRLLERSSTAECRPNPSQIRNHYHRKRETAW